MRHRHIREGFEESIVAVEDILTRGSVDDWRELASRVREDPKGASAQALRAVVENVYMYGTTVIWRNFLKRLERGSSLTECG